MGDLISASRAYKANTSVINEKAFANLGKNKPISISETGLEIIEFLSVDCMANVGEWHSDSEIKIDKLGFVIENGIKTKEFWNGSIKSENLPLRLKIRNICGDETIWDVGGRMISIISDSLIQNNT